MNPTPTWPVRSCALAASIGAALALLLVYGPGGLGS